MLNGSAAGALEGTRGDTMKRREFFKAGAGTLAALAAAQGAVAQGRFGGGAPAAPFVPGPLRVDAYGTPTFAEGPHAGEAIFEHPLHLAWIEKAKVRRADGWHFRYPESTRQWVRRWLKVRASGRARQSVKSFRADDWTLDSCIASSRAGGSTTFDRPSAVRGC